MSKISKLFLLFLLFLSLLTLSTADHIEDVELDFPDVEAPYGGEAYNNEIHCEGSDCPLLDISVEVCWNGDDGHVRGYADDSGDGVTYTFHIEEPTGTGDSNKCAPDEYTLAVYDYDASGDLEQFGRGGSHKLEHNAVSENLMVSQNWVQGRSDQLQQWRIRPTSESGGDPEPGEVDLYLNPRGISGGGDRDIREAQTGTILSSENDGLGYANNINELLEDNLRFDYDECYNDICEMSTIDLGDSPPVDGDDSWNSECDGRCPLGHMSSGDSSTWDLEGEVIMGQGFDPLWDDPPESVDYPLFHHCHPNLGYASSFYEAVYSPGTYHGTDYFECNSWTGEWEPYEQDECEEQRIGDVVYSNDGDTEFPGKGLLYNLDLEGDYYDSTIGSGCRYQTVDTESKFNYLDLGSDATQVFYCTDDGEKEGYEPRAEDGDYDWKEERYSEYLEQEAEEECDTVDMTEPFDEKVPVAEYFVPMKLVPFTRDTHSDFYFYNDELSTYQGVVQHQLDALTDAHQTYSTEDSYDKESWYDADLGGANISNPEVYEGDAEDLDTDEIEAEWIAGNAGGYNESNVGEHTVSTRSDHVTPFGSDPEGIFRGGWAPKCPEGTVWTYDSDSDRWWCSAELDWNHQIYVPTMNYADEVDARSRVEIGFHILPINLVASSAEYPEFNSFQEATSEAEEEAALEEIYGMCWFGDTNDIADLEDSEEDERWVSFKVDNLPDDPENPIPVYEYLDSDEYDGEFRCRFVYKDTEDNYHDRQGHLEVTGASIDSIEDIKEERGYDAAKIDEYAEQIDPSDFGDISQEWESENGINIENIDGRPNPAGFNEDYFQEP